MVCKLESLYCLAIVNDRSIRSLRDLTGSHLKLLRNIRYRGLFPTLDKHELALMLFVFTSSNESLEAISQKFGADVSSLRVYVHYQPTYYHFHVHFTHVKMLHGKFESQFEIGEPATDEYPFSIR